MALDNFKGTLWSDAIQASLDNALVAGALVTSSFEGEIGRNKTVRVNKLDSISTFAYDGETPISPDALGSTYADLDVDQARAFAFKVDDVDAAQTSAPVLSDATAKAARALATDIDSFIVDLMDGDATEIGPKAIDGTSVTAYTIALDCATALDENNAPADGRFALVTPAFAAQLALDPRLNRATASGDAVAASGFVGEVAGLMVYKTNQCPSGTVIAGHPSAVAFVQQVSSTEALRSESYFADVVRGLAVYGAEVLEPAALVKCSWTVAS